jgi:hypothetical protein
LGFFTRGRKAKDRQKIKGTWIIIILINGR